MNDRASTVLVTGGAGYIGSHAADRLLRDGRRVVILDNLVLGHREAVARLEARHPGMVSFIRGDAGDPDVLDALFISQPIDAVMHFAAFASVGESVVDPFKYYRNNTKASLELIEACHRARVTRFVFSSTCATFGMPAPEHLPITETCPQSPVNPYGWSKLAVEHILSDGARACNFPFAAACLRYFNVAGCDPAGVFGEDHTPETHLIPILLQVALGQREHATIFGTDYDTPDGTCIRDYIHVQDLIDAHVAVLDALRPAEPAAGTMTYNLGIGRGVSVREVIDAAVRVTGIDIPIRHGPRRPGDPPVLYADPGKIQRELGWHAAFTDLDAIIATAWDWIRAHPRGYASQPAASGEDPR